MKAVNNYLKNVMKSVAYAAADVSEEYVPGVKEFASTNKEFATATYAALKNPSQFVRKQVEAIQESKIYKALDYGARNLSEDLRTGNFYNKARKERDELALSGLDTNWDDLSEFGIDSDWENKLDSSSSKANDEITAGDMRIVESIEGSNAALASATVNAVITSSQNEIKNNRANTAMLYSQNERLFGGLHKDMTVLSSTMQQMYKLQYASLQNIDKNMSSFFTQESKLSTERNAILKEMLEMQRNMYKSAADREKEAANKKKSNRVRWSDINTNGIVDINAYFGAVKKNINNQLASIMPAGFGEDSNMLATFMVSPLEGAMKYVVNGVIPATVKAAAKEFDASVSGIFGNIIGELGNARSKNEGGLLGTIAKFLGISTSVNRNIDTSRYEKGPVPFDGITRKAIIDVIPTHLRRIEAAITGRPEEMFDYKAGRWVKVSNVKKQFDNIKKNAVKRATSELREAMNPGVQAVRRGIDNKYDQDSFDKAVEEFEEFLYDNNGRFNPKISASKNGISAATYPNLYKHYSKIKTIYRDFDRIESRDKSGRSITRNTKNRIRMRLSNSVLDAKDSEEKQYRDIESDVGNVLQAYFGIPKADAHGKYKSNGKFEAYNILNNAKDNLGNTVFDYLQNINKELTWMRLNGVPGGGGRRSKYKTEAVSFDKINIANPNKPTDNYASETSNRERIAKSALAAITSGKAIDLRDFDTDEQAYLLQLSSMISNSAVGEYKSEIKGYNENMISGFMDKHFIKTNIKSLKDVDEAIKKANKEGKNTNEVSMDPKEEKFFKKIMNRIGAGETVLGGIVGASSEAFTNLLYTADKAIYEMMYKTEISDESRQKYNGFMEAMVGKMSDTFKTISDKFKEDILDPFKKRLGIDDDFKNRFKAGLKNTGSTLWTAFRDANSSVYGPMLDKIKNSNIPIVEDIKLQKEKEKIAENLRKKFDDKKEKAKRKNSDSLASKKARDIRTAAAVGHNDPWSVAAMLEWGKNKKVRFYSDNEHELEERLESMGLVTKEKLEAIRTHSTDENGDFNLDIYRAALIKIYNRHLSKQHAKGTPSGKPFKGLTTLTKGEGLISGRGVGVVPKTGVYNVTTPTHIINTEDMHSLTGGARVSVQSALGKEKLAAKAAGFNIAHHDEGTIDIKDGKLDTKGFLSEVKKYIPEAASGGLIGGILSLVLGTVGGPLVGAAVGAGGSILASSDTLKTKLFGKAGKDGKNDGSGLISKTVMDSLNKYFPDMAKYGLAGIIPGLLTPLGPVGGLMVGGAFGYLKNNERFTNKYFGEKGKLTIGSKEKKIIEQMMPGAAKGAVAGVISTLLLPTPWGILGNAAIGAGVGMMASTDEFKEMLLGVDIDGVRSGGLVGAIKDAFSPLTDALVGLKDKLVETFDKNIVDPIARFVTPAIHAIPQVLGIIPRKISEYLKNTITKTIGERLKKWFSPATFLGKAAAKVTGTVSNIVTSPFRLIGRAGDAIRTRQINTMNADYMTAKERIQHMTDNEKDASEFDKQLANMDLEQIKDLKSSVAYRLDNTKDLQSKVKKSGKEIQNTIDKFEKESGVKLSSKAKEKIRKALNTNQVDKIPGIIQNDGLSKEEANRLLNGDSDLKTKLNTYGDLFNRRERARNKTKEDDDMNNAKLQEEFKKLGIKFDPNDTHSFEKLYKYLTTEELDRQANSDTVKNEFAVAESSNQHLSNIVNLITGTNDLLARLNTNLGDDKAQEYADQVKSSIQQSENKTNKIYDARGKKSLENYGGDTSKLSNEVIDEATRKGSQGQFKKAGKTNVSEEQMNESHAKIKRIAEINKILGPNHIDTSAISSINSLSDPHYEIFIKTIKQKSVKKYVNKAGIVYNKDDINYIIGIGFKPRGYNLRCKYIVESEDYNSFPRVKDVMTMDAVTMANLKAVGRINAKPVNEASDNTEETKAEQDIQKATETNAYGTIAKHGIGTTILSGLFNAGKAVVSGAGKLAKGAVKGIGSLFSGDSNKDAALNAGLMGSLLGAGHGFFGGYNLPTGGNTDEVDKPGDGKDVVHVGGGKLIQVKRDSSGNVEPDTADSKTKTVLNELAIKENSNTKLQEAQLKATELIKANFDTSDIRESKGGKLGWLSMLLLGGYLWKSGIIKKLFDGFIKPVWTDHIKPWITDTAVPWIKSMWTDKIKPFFTDTVAPWITDTVVPAIGTAFAGALELLIQQLPKLIWNGIKGIFNVGATVLDTATGNKTNVGAKTTVNGNELAEQYGSDYETGMYDENGNALTASDIANGNYNKIYNAQGIEGTVNNDGTVTFKDDSKKGSSYASTVGNAAAHSFGYALATGKANPLINGAMAINKALINPGATIKSIPGISNLANTKTGAKVFEWLGNRKIVKAGNFLSKAAGYTGQFLTKPVEYAQNLGLKGNNWLNRLLNTAAENVDNNVVYTTTAEVVDDVAEAAANSAVNKAVKEGAESTALSVVENTTKNALTLSDDVAKATTKNSGLLSKLITKAKELIEKLFSNSTIKNKLASVAESLGINAIDDWIKGFKNQIDDILTEALEKGIKKAGADTVKKVLSKVLAIAFLVADFITGCDQAESILGVSETSLIEEVVAGLINAICNFLIIPSIFPGTNWFARKIYGLFDKNLEERQNEATEEYDKYVEETGSTLTKEEYLKRKNSLTGKVGGWISDKWKEAGGFKGVAKNALIASNPLLSMIKNTNSVFSWAKDKVSSNAEGTISLSEYTANNTMTLGSISSILGNITEGLKFNDLDKAIERARDGKISVFSKDYWKTSNDSDNTLAGTVKKSYSMLTKIINLPMLMIKGALDGLVSNIDDLGNVVSGTTSTTSSSSTTTTTFGGKLKSIFSSAISKIKNFFGLGTGSYRYGTGIYSKQIDPSVAGIRFNASGDSEYQTIGNSGCGPAAAVNALESMYGRGNAVASAAKFAISRGYKETDGGTKPGFFADYFNSNGYGSQTSYSKSVIERNINSGMPTVIMGQDAKGVSSSTPFGKTPHYVTVTGTDGRGNAIVQDPESSYDNQLYPIKSLMKNTSLGVSAFGKKYRRRSGRGKWGRSSDSVVSTFSSILINSKAGRALGLFDVGSSSSSSATTSITTSIPSSINTGTFPTYALNDAQIKGIANILEHEQPGLSGMLAEASLMANLTDIKGDEYATVENLVAKATGGWFAKGKERFNNPGNPSDDAIKAAKIVFLYGRRTLPRYVNEHDCFSDISSVTTNGNKNSIKDRSGYVQHVTKINNTYGSSYTFYSFPNDKADPFGYTDEAMRAKWGDNCYDVDTATSGLGSLRRKSGRGKWGRGTAEQIWWYLTQKMGMTEAGAAGLMGNLKHESGLQFNNVENLLENKDWFPYNDETYTEAIDNGEVSRELFLHPKENKQYGYGLAQWTSPGRKGGLYDLVKSKNVSIADPATQLEWLDTELNNSYSNVLSVLKSTNNLQEASDIVLSKFEQPSNWQSQTATRAATGQELLNQFRGTTGEEVTGATALSGSSSDTSAISGSIVGALTNILNNSQAGQALNLILGTNSSSSSYTSTTNTGSSTASGDAAKVVEIAKGEVGTKETPQNYVKYNDWFWGDGKGGSSLPWCAAFVSWVGNQAGISTDIIPKDAYTVTAYQKLISNGGQVSNSDARPGDIVYFTKNGSPSGIYHTGIVTGNNNGVLSTVEGNSNDMVAEKNYNTNDSKVLIARPQYVNAGDTSSVGTIASVGSTLISSVPDYSNTRGSNGVKPLSRFGQFKNSIYGRGSNSSKTMHNTRDGYTKVERSAVDTQLGNALKSASFKNKYGVSTTGMGTVRYGMAGSADYSKLINSIISILMTIADNTDKLNLIVSILNNKLNLNITESDVSNATTDKESLKAKLSSALNGINSNTSKFNTYADSVGDNSINSIISAMNAIASE